ncbi:hypothetical protein FQN54_006265 [Arachnomyces sp. PD_36]|nr:hypothetical protein FQN54_006265 [Arachnomyces sp. PD_36]
MKRRCRDQLLRQNVSPVTALEFYNALIGLWRGSWRSPSRKPLPDRLGLAVSGGGDSMALAYLCHQLVSQRLIPGLSLKAFVVDHHARKESTEEANKVSGWLEDLGLQSKILTLQWPSGAVPSGLSDFETQARKLRYQALGTACRDNKIPALLLGHHQDDNIETVIMRLSQGQRGLGLKGVPKVGHLPECHGIYGVSGSGTTMDLTDIKSRRIRSDAEKSTETGSNMPDGQIPISDGGISILRPLNSFQKARLLATCNDNGVPFVNDPTNFDFGLTPRNTVRYLLSSGRLPEKFQPLSILKMIKEGKAMDEHLTTGSSSVLKESKILKFDRRLGKLLIQFPPSSDLGTPDPKTRTLFNEDFNVKEKAEALTIRRIIDLVSPGGDNAVGLEDCQKLVGRIFPKDNETQNSTARNKFTLSGVQFEKMGSAQPNTWLLTREPFRSTQEKPATTITIPSRSTSNNGDLTTTTPWSEWHLWDNRYWIRVQASHSPLENGKYLDSTKPLNIIIRPLEKSDLPYIRQHPRLIKRTVSKTDGSQENPADSYITISDFGRLLSSCAPGNTRFTIPVLAEATGEKRVLALPTLGITVPSEPSMVQGEEEQDYLPALRWEVRYKKVDPEVLGLTQAVV